MEEQEVMATQIPPDRDAVLGYLVLRICLGMNIAMHGVTRVLAGPSVFAGSLTKQFANTILPPWSVHAFGMFLPWIETVIGLLVLIGFATRYSLVAGGLLIALLTFGTALTQQWDVAGLQLIYATAFALLLIWHRHNLASVDVFLSGRKRP